MTSKQELELAIAAAWDRLKAARTAGDDLAGGLAADELDALLDELYDREQAAAATAAVMAG